MLVDGKLVAFVEEERLVRVKHANATFPEKSIEFCLQEAGINFNHVVKTTIFITDMHRFTEMNEVYGKYFTSDFPARETVQVPALPKFVNVEICMIAVK